MWFSFGVLVLVLVQVSWPHHWPAHLHVSRWQWIYSWLSYKMYKTAVYTHANVSEDYRDSVIRQNSVQPTLKAKRSLRMLRVTWPVCMGQNLETATYLESSTPICLFTMTFSWGSDEKNKFNTGLELTFGLWSANACSVVLDDSVFELRRKTSRVDQKCD